jgi:hypothetical protein
VNEWHLVRIEAVGKGEYEAMFESGAEERSYRFVAEDVALSGVTLPMLRAPEFEEDALHAGLGVRAVLDAAMAFHKACQEPLGLTPEFEFRRPGFAGGEGNARRRLGGADGGSGVAGCGHVGRDRVVGATVGPDPSRTTRRHA